ncbi:alpha/beta hydrolase [Yeosuana sp. MJ-SS3]|uniref:Alpha/beta hydrolase n=1 Tax=Gilvirhabdus luticola TaxID=3079858 RepID=A0ABU3U5Z7_9FLAO|nr:alpha/beta hydrolase [Yeosuana sp. MJ-SS3]MDU8885761.1 alpha/beta hydrolase [Yeosuana sp. MJ-SS3]
MKLINPILTFVFIVFLFMINGCKTEIITTVKSFDGVSISFDNEGKGEPVIILVHGWSNNKSIWEAQISHFSKKYRVIAIDLPGFGESGNNRSEWTITSYGEDVSSIIQQLNLKKVVLVGFSMGAPIVIEAANKAPDHVIGLVLVDQLQEVEMQIPPPMALYLDSVMMDLVNNPTKEKMVGGGFIKNNVDSSFNRIVSFLEGASHIGWRESLEDYIKWQNEHCIHSVKTVKAPIISINSDLQPTNVEAFRKYVPTFKAKIVEDVGHLIMWDDTEEFNRLLEESIQDFIKE